jgi:SAM-dependent methyltransferase
VTDDDREERESADRPASWLTANAHLLPTEGDALDVACGRGRHALWLGARGLRVRAIDRDTAAVAAVNEAARSRHLPVHAHVVDLEVGETSLPEQAYDLIVVVHYLHRPLVPALVAALRPRGMLVYETFTRAQAARGKPTNPAFLLERGELTRLVSPLRVLVEREGDVGNRSIASVIACRPPREGP